MVGRYRVRETRVRVSLQPLPPGALLRVWTAAGMFEMVGRFSTDDPQAFRTEDGLCTMIGVGYCRIEDAETGHVYYDNGTLVESGRRADG
jgi:hypothetical protein